MAPLGQYIAKRGFQAVIFAAGGHIASREERIGFLTYIKDTREAAHYLGEEFHATIGLSAGAITMMRVRAKSMASGQIGMR